MYTLNIVRRKGWYGKFRKLIIVADGVKVGAVKDGHTSTVQVPDTARVLHGRMDWAKTKPLDLTFVEDGDMVIFKGWLTLNIIRNLGLISMPMSIECVSKAKSKIQKTG